MTQDADGPKLHIDSDWKAQAQAEKQRLAEQSKARAAPAGADAAAGAGGATEGASGGTSGGAFGGASGGMPPANFETLMSTIATQALFALGAIPDPRTGQRVAHLDLARHHIDMLTVLEDKTKGNLSDEESTALASTIYELRSRYVQIASSQRPG